MAKPAQVPLGPEASLQNESPFHVCRLMIANFVPCVFLQHAHIKLTQLSQVHRKTFTLRREGPAIVAESTHIPGSEIQFEFATGHGTW